APCPSSEYREQRQQNSPGEGLWFEAGVVGSECFRELKKEIDASSGNRRGENACRKVMDQRCFLKQRKRHHANHGTQRKCRIISAPVRNHLVKPLRRLFFKTEVTAQKCRGDLEGVIQVLQRWIG